MALRRGLWLSLAVVLALALAAAAAEPARDLHHAAKAIADDIESQRLAQGLPENLPPKEPLNSSKMVRFKLSMKRGKGSDQASVYCFGYTLFCRAQVIGPANTYSGRVSTSEGSVVKFEGKSAGDFLDMVLKTQFWGDTTFGVVLRAADRPWPREAEVELRCSY